MSDVVSSAPAGAPPRGLRRSADWGGKALLVCALALLMAIPGLFVFALIADRTHRADTVAVDISAQQGGAQQLLGPLVIVPYSYPVAGAPRTNPDGTVAAPSPPQTASGWYVISPEKGAVKINVKTQILHRGIFDVPVYNATAAIDATFGPAPAGSNLPAQSTIDWSRARVVLGFSDLRGAKADVVGTFADATGKTQMNFAPSSSLGLGAAGLPASVDRHLSRPDQDFGLVSAPAAKIVASPAGGVFHADLRLTGAQRLSVLPFAKSTTATIAGDWGTPSFDGGFLPETRATKGQVFSATWNVPFIARGLSDNGDSEALSLQALGKKDLGVTFVRANNPYQNVTRALKYAVMFVGLVFLTFFVFEALSGRRVHPAQYVLIGLAQMVFYLLLLSLSEYLGFDVAFGIAAVATVGLIGLYAGWAFRSGAYRARALVIFTIVYALIYLLMRLEDFALLAGSIASFLGLSAGMYLTRHIDWYGGRNEEAQTAPKA